MKDKMIIFTHNDLDAMGCLLVLNEKFPDTNFEKSVYHTNYQNIPEQINAIMAECETQKPKLIVMCDVSFSTSEETLQQFYNYCTARDISMLYIDHHLYPEGFFDQFPKMKTFWDKSKCASKIAFDLFYQFAAQTDNLTKLIGIIDVYDIWQDQHKWFGWGQRLNNYFWHRVINKKNTVGGLALELKNREFKLFDDFMEVTNKIDEDNEATLAKLETSGLIHRNVESGVTLILSEKCFNQFMIKEHKNGQSFVIGISNWGLIRVRVNQHTDVNVSTLDLIRLRCTGTTDIGHSHAFTWKSDLDFKNEPEDSLITEAKRITGIIQEGLPPVYMQANNSFDEDIPF